MTLNEQLRALDRPRLQGIVREAREQNGPRRARWTERQRRAFRLLSARDGGEV